MAYDGSIIFSTKIDDKGFESGAKNLSSKVLALKNKISSTRTEIEKLSRELAQIGNEPIKSNEAISLEKTVATTENKLRNLYTQADKIGDGVKSDLLSMGFDLKYLDNILAQNSGWQKLQAEIDKTEILLDEYKQKLQQVSANQQIGKDTEEYQRKQQKLQSLTDKLGVYETQLSEVKEKEQATADATQKSNKDVSRYTATLKAVKKALGNLVTVLGRVCSRLKSAFSTVIANQIKKIGRNTSKTNSQMNLFAKALKRIKTAIVGMLFYKVISSAINSLKDGINQLVKVCPTANKQMSELMSSLTYLKSSLATAFAPILTVITPIITKFVDNLSLAINKIGQFIAALTGQKTYTKAIKVQKDYAKSLDKTAASTQDLTDANNKNLASFDELNVMQADSGSKTSASADDDDVSNYVTVPTMFSDFAKRIKNALQSTDWSEIGAVIGQKLDGILNKIDWSKIIGGLKNAATRIVTLLNGFINAADWGLIGKTVARGVESALMFLYTLITGFDFSKLGEALGVLINNALSTYNASMLAKTLSGFITGLSNTLISLISTIDFDKISQTIIAFLSNIKWGNLSKVAVNLLSAVSKAIAGTDFNGIHKAIVSGVQKINWTGLWNGLVNVTTSAIKGITDLFGLKGISTSKLKSALNNVKKPIDDMLKSLGTMIKTLIVPVINNLLPSIVRLVGSVAKAISPIVKALTPLLETLINSVSRVITAISPIVEKIGQVIGSIVKALTPIIEPILNLIAQITEILSPALDLILGAVKGIFDVLGYITQGVSDVIGSLLGVDEQPTISSTMQAEIDNLASISEDLTTVKDNIESTINSVDESLANTSNDLQYIDDLQDRMDVLLSKSTLTDDDMQELNTIADLLGEKLPDFKNTWDQMVEKDGDGKLQLTGTQEEIRASIDQTIDKMKEQYATEALAEQYKELYKEQVISNQEIAKAVSDVSEAQNKVNAATMTYNKAHNELAKIGYGENGWNDAKEAEQKAKDEMDAYNDALTDAQTNLLIAQGKVGGLDSKMSSLNNTMKVVNGEFDINKDNLQELRDAYDNGFIDLDTIKKEYGLTAEELFASTESMANQTIAGYKKGIADGVIDITNAGGEIGESAIEGAYAALDINSPSKEFENIANYTVAGFANRIQSDKSAVRAISRWAHRIIDAAADVLTNYTWIAHVDNVINRLAQSFKNVLNSILYNFENFFNYMNFGLNELIRNLNVTNKRIGTATKSAYTIYPTYGNIEIPKLATGTVIPANYGEFLAVLGDNKREAEVVSPISAMKQAMAEVLSEFGGTGDGGNIYLTVELDGNVVYQNVVDHNDRYKIRHGKSRLA